MTDEQIFSVIQRALKIKRSIEFSDDLKPGDIEEWDSMGHMLLIMELEKEFGVTFEYDDILEMDSVGKICTILKTKYRR